MAKLTDFQLFENVLIYLARIDYYSSDLTKAISNKDFKTQDAILYCVEQFGKNVCNISDKFKEQHSEIHILDWHLFSGFADDNYFIEDELFEVLDSLLSKLDTIETMYLKERQKPGNRDIAKIPAKAFRNIEGETLPLKRGEKTNLQYDSSIDKKRGFNPRNHITSHSSIWTVKKK